MTDPADQIDFEPEPISEEMDALAAQGAQGVILGSLGPVLAERLDSPFLALAKSVGVEGAFQRVESVIAAVGTLADLTMATLLLFALRTAGKVVVPKVPEKRLATGALLLAVVLAGAIFQDGRAQAISRSVVPVGNLVLGFGVPALLLFFRKLCGKNQ